MPSNLMTPRIFADRVAQQLSDLENVEVYGRYVYMAICIINISFYLSLSLFLMNFE